MRYLGRVMNDEVGCSQRWDSRYAAMAAASLSLVLLVAGCGSSQGDVASSSVDVGSGANGDRPDETDGLQASDGGTESDPGTATGAGTGAGSATITISGTEYAFTSDECASSASSFDIAGSGQSGGESFTAKISLDQSTDQDDDGEPDTVGSVKLKGDDGGSVYLAAVMVYSHFGESEDFTFELSPGATTGSGKILDLIAGGEDTLEFSGKCN